MPNRAGNATMFDERALRMMALQIAAQLPESRREAEIVLKYTQELLDGFIFKEQPAKAKEEKAHSLRVV